MLRFNRVPKIPSPEDLLRTQRFFNRPCSPARAELAPFERHSFEAISELIPPGTCQDLAVDLGCHRGRYTLVLAESYGRVVAVDVADEPLRTAPRSPNVEYRVLDLENTRIELDFGGPVSFFLAVGLFEMLAHPEKLCQRLYHLAAPRAKILVVIPNRRSVHYRTFRAELWFARRVLGRSRAFISNNGASRRRVIDWLKTAGFVPREADAIVGVPPAFMRLVPPSLQPTLLTLDSAALRLFGGAYDWVLAERAVT